MEKIAYWKAEKSKHHNVYTKVTAISRSKSIIRSRTTPLDEEILEEDGIIAHLLQSTRMENSKKDMVVESHSQC